MSYTMYTPLNVWLDPASVTDVVAYIQTYLSENTIYSEEEIEELIHDYLIAHPELIGGVQSVNGKTGAVVLSASDINTANNVTIESVLSSLSSQISSIAASVATNTSNITSLTGRVTTAETDLANLKSKISDTITKNLSTIATMTSTGGGNINASCGSVGHVEAGSQYTLSLTNETTKTPNLSIRIIEDGTTTQTVIGNKTLAVGERTVYTFFATLTGNVVLNTALGSEYASTVVFTYIQLEVGNTPTWYAEKDELTAYDKIARNQLENVSITLKETAFESNVFSVAHQGGNIFGYPQNTIPNFIACAKAHWKYVELDVQWTSDNVPVISHDDTRTIYGTSTNVSIANTSYSDLQNMQFFADTSIKIPSFYDAIDTCKLYGLTPFVEIKTNITQSQITIIINYLKRKKLFSNSFITSFQIGKLITVISIDNNTNTLLNVSSTASINDLITSDNRVTTLLNHAGKTAFAFSYTLLAGLADVKTHLSEYSDTGAYICVYTLDTEALITTYAPMCDYITSNALRVEEVIA